MAGDNALPATSRRSSRWSPPAPPRVEQPTVGWQTVRDFVMYSIILINVVSMLGMVAGVLMHSGRGGGLSDMFGGGGGAALGSSAAERNLTRITTCFALVWLMSIVAL